MQTKLQFRFPRKLLRKHITSNIIHYRTINEPQSTNDKLVEHVLKENSLNYLNSTLNNITKKDLSKTKLKLTDDITVHYSNHFDINNNTSIISHLLNAQSVFPFGKRGFVYKPATKGSWFRGRVVAVNTNGKLFFKYYMEKNNVLLLIAKKFSRNEYQIYGDEMLRVPISKLTNNFLGNQYVLQNNFSNNSGYIRVDNSQILCKVKYVSLFLYLDI